MEDIKRIARPTDVPDYGLLNDLLWSDPSETAVDWEDNERGVSYCFGKSVINEFLAKVSRLSVILPRVGSHTKFQWDMDLVCRAHMVVEDGYEFWNDRTLVTVFSAPNYCGGMSDGNLIVWARDLHVPTLSEFDNYGACMRFVRFLRAIGFHGSFKFSVSEDLLCAFELLKPLDPAVIKKELSKAKRKRSASFSLVSADETHLPYTASKPNRF